MVESGGATQLRAEDFETIKMFILAHGDRETFSAMYSHNPHFAFAGVDAFLLPSTGQQNINCDPALSDFSGIVLRTSGPSGQKYGEVSLDRSRNVVSIVPRAELPVAHHWSRILADIRTRR